MNTAHIFYYEMATPKNFANNIPLPPALKIQSGDVSANWKRFKGQWSNYELATDLTGEAKEKRTAIFLSCIGSDAYDVFQSMVFDDDANRSDIDQVIRAFDDYCIGETNLTYERYLLNKRVQEQNESFDVFMTELRRLVKSCDYGTLEESILKDRIVIGIRDDSTRRKLLQCRKLDLQTAIDICRASETASRHLREIKGSESEDVNKMNTCPRKEGTARGRERSKSRDRKPREQQQQLRRRDDNTGGRKCKFCGKAHEFKKELCPAWNKICTSCQKRNHFSTVCKAYKST